MSFYFQPQGEWSALNKEAQKLFAPGNEKADIRVYAGAAHALLEFTLGFREQFPLKKKYYYFKDLDPHFAAAATALAKAGLQVTALNLSSLEKLDELVASFDREFGFLFYPYDNPVTGEIYPFAALEKVLAEKAFPRLISVYGDHRINGLKATLDRSEARMYSFSLSDAQDSLALLALGERMRFASPVAATLSPIAAESLQKAARDFRRESHERTVREFENRNLGEAKALFSPDRTVAGRLYDRAVIYWEDMDGFAFIDALAKEMGRQLQGPGLDWRFETTSLSRWGGIRTMDWLKPQGLTPEQIRGLVTLDARLLTPEFETLFLAARAAVVKAQSGE